VSRVDDGLPAVSAQSARLVLVRPWRLIGAAIQPVLFDGARQKVIAVVLNSSWAAVELEPGNYFVCAAPLLSAAALVFPPDTVASTGFTSPITRLTLAPGQTQLARVDVLGEALVRPRVEIVPLSEGSDGAARVDAMRAETHRVGFDSQAREIVDSTQSELLAQRFEACRSGSSDEWRLSNVPPL
jgi:hypothetical protein